MSWSDITLGNTQLGEIKGWSQVVFSTKVHKAGYNNRIAELGLICLKGCKEARDIIIYDHDDNQRYHIVQSCGIEALCPIPCVFNTIRYEIRDTNDRVVGSIASHSRFQMFFCTLCWNYDVYKVEFDPNASGIDRLALINAAVYLDNIRRRALTPLPMFFL